MAYCYSLLVLTPIKTTSDEQQKHSSKYLVASHPLKPEYRDPDHPWMQAAESKDIFDNVGETKILKATELIQNEFPVLTLQISLLASL